eukprot:TRINITY_DN3618_c0_g1_i5.p1 TRINITY_DN3618_c0_g1~~TRINITY_DN3618_c0_g1_i5.p1  ORF type:complete len:158 (-),score=8.72 TRINITY_DN3618_c0_g1_i5:441-914(-)
MSNPSPPKYDVALIYSCPDREALVKAIWSGWRGLQVESDIDSGCTVIRLLDEEISQTLLPLGQFFKGLRFHLPQLSVQRGFRQGDPISGYLFNMALDILNLIIKKFLDFNFNCRGICNQVAKSIDSFPSKYVMSKVTFWSQCEPFYNSEWITANQNT